MPNDNERVSTYGDSPEPEGVPTEKPTAKAKMTPKEEKEATAYVSGLVKLLHGKDTKTKVYEMLQSAPPEVSIPQAALVINNQMEEAVRGKGKPPSLKTLISAGVYLVSDLIEIGNSGGFFQISEEQAGPILQSTLQEYIVQGVKKGTIDPIEIQKVAEENMSPEQKAQGLSAGQANGISAQAGQGQAMEMYAQDRERKVQSRMQGQVDKALQGNASANIMAGQGQVQQPVAGQGQTMTGGRR